MKYWWLEKYKNIKVKMLPELYSDISYFLVMPKNYRTIYKTLENIPVSMLSEEEMCINLYGISETKNVKNNRLQELINQLLLVPDTSLPISDYSFQEILDEIKSLKTKKPLVEKLENNNVAACYNCLNVFYVDKIRKINKKNECLCPFCGKNKLYFDNDFIPMNYSFLLLSKFYYGVSRLGCDFSKIKKLVKKGICIKVEEKGTKESLEFLEKYKDKKIYGEDEQKLVRDFYKAFTSGEESGGYEKILSIEWDTNKNVFELSILLVLSIIQSLANSFYLKRVVLYANNQELKKSVNRILHMLTK